MTTLEILRRGRERVAKGWCPDGPGNERTTWCVATAVEYHGGAYDVFASVLGYDHRIMMTPWNDAPGRTQAEVVALFDRAIAAEEAKE